ncbi:MAG: hypothetical protein HQ591_09100 [candidate division Zixibacteria bacterium]|nr:hypothetical protein [Candidatus Tariuqbacter arcticus]
MFNILYILLFLFFISIGTALLVFKVIPVGKVIREIKLKPVDNKWIRISGIAFIFGAVVFILGFGVTSIIAAGLWFIGLIALIVALIIEIESK